MGRSPCCDKVGLKKGPWTPEEDQKLLAYIDQNGHGSWRLLPPKAGLRRCGKSCRLRWTNYLRPDIKRGKFSLQEEQTIIQLHALLGNRWSTIANHLAKRTDNEIKNYWNTHLKKRLSKMGIDPVTHRQKRNTLFGPGSSATQSKDISHTAQWESARLEAEARLVRESKLVSSTCHHHPPPIGSSASAQLLSQATAVKVPALPPCLDILKVWQGTTWAKPNAAGFLTSSIGSLESPTSTLHFFDDVFKIPIAPANNYVENLKTDDSKYLGKRNEEAAADESGNITMLHDVNCINDAATFMESFAELLPDNADDIFNITGLCDDNLHSSCSGSLEDNKKYWNAIC